MQKTKILIFEDSTVISNILKIILEEYNYNVIGIYTNAVDGVKSLDIELPDLIIMDIVIKGNIDGVDTARIIKNKYKIPIIFLTSNTDREVFEKAKNSGADGFLIKDTNLNYNIIHHIDFAINKQIQERKVRESEEKFRYIAENTYDGIISLNSDFSFQYVSPAFLKSLNYNNLSEIGDTFQDLLNLIHQDFKEKIISQFNSALKKELKTLVYDYQIYNKDGKLIWHQDDIHINYDSKGNFSVAVIISRDITEHKESQIKLEQLNQNLVEVNATKDKFFSIIAHDLKNPLGNFRDVTKLLFEEYADFEENDKLEFIELMKNSAENIYSLLENLLEWSRSQRGIINYSPVELNLKLLCVNVFNLLKPNADKKNIELINNIPVHSNIEADTYMINTVFRNLISNAIKFTPENGKIEIGVTKLKNILSSNKDCYFVKDSGVGMDSTTINKLFKIDTQVTTLGTNEEKGTGLGLLLCKEFIDNHKGEIWVESVIGQGTTFYFTLHH